MFEGKLFGYLLIVCAIIILGIGLIGFFKGIWESRTGTYNDRDDDSPGNPPIALP